MIVERLDEARQRLGGHPRLAEALALLSRPEVLALPAGRHPVDGDVLFVNVVRGQGLGQAAYKLEAHRVYLDVQYVVSGQEILGWRQTSSCTTVAEPYDAQRDVEFYADPVERWLAVPPGSLVVCLPEDAHAPQAGTGPIHKVVVKLRLDAAGL